MATGICTKNFFYSCEVSVTETLKVQNIFAKNKNLSNLRFRV